MRKRQFTTTEDHEGQRREKKDKEAGKGTEGKATASEESGPKNALRRTVANADIKPGDIIILRGITDEEAKAEAEAADEARKNEEKKGNEAEAITHMSEDETGTNTQEAEKPPWICNRCDTIEEEEGLTTPAA